MDWDWDMGYGWDMVGIWLGYGMATTGTRDGNRNGTGISKDWVGLSDRFWWVWMDQISSRHDVR